MESGTEEAEVSREQDNDRLNASRCRAGQEQERPRS